MKEVDKTIEKRDRSIDNIEFSSSGNFSRKRGSYRESIKDKNASNKIWLRQVGFIGVFGLLGIQNWGLFHFLNKSLEYEVIQDIQTVLSIVTTATLAESYLLARTAFQWLYKDHKGLDD